MSQPNFDHLDIKDDFEFNDGVGDVLKEKETYSFSWKKTFLVLGGITICILLLTFILLEIGKKALNLNQTSLEAAVESNEMIDRLLTEEAKTSWDMIPDVEEVTEVYDGSQYNNTTEPDRSIKEVKPEPVKVITPKIAPKPIIKKEVKSVSGLTNTTYRVIAGSFSKYSNAKSRLNSLKKNGIDGFIWQSKSSKGQTIYKLQVGSFKSYQSAKQHMADLQKKNIDSYILN